MEIHQHLMQIKAKAGDAVEAGDVLVFIESMKMLISVITEDAGT